MDIYDNRILKICYLGASVMDQKLKMLAIKPET